MALTEKRKLFADEYLIDLNASRAYRVAYPRVKDGDTAAAAASRLLKIKDVSEYISVRMQERSERTEITQDRVLNELASIAFAKATDYAEVRDGQVIIKNTADLSDTMVRAIAGIKEGRNGVEIKLNDKGKALELLGRHLGMFKDRMEVSGLEEEKSKLDDLINQMRYFKDFIKKLNHMDVISNQSQHQIKNGEMLLANKIYLINQMY